VFFKCSDSVVILNCFDSVVFFVFIFIGIKHQFTNTSLYEPNEYKLRRATSSLWLYVILIK
jgi:hypothetical protein